MVKKPTYEKLEQKDQLAPTPWRIYLLICIVGVLITGMLGYGFFKGDRMNRVYAPLIDAAMEIKLETAFAHLWFEEIISGDRHEDISVVWKHQDQAEWYAQAMLEGRKNPEGTFIPLDDAEMRRKIKNVQGKLKEFRRITQKRIETKGLSGIGTDIDQRYDHVFRSFLKEADEVETRLQQVMAKDLSSFRYTQVLLIVTSILLFLALGISFWYFDSQRADNFLFLHEANKALQESEENLSITLNSIGDAVIATDTEERIIRMNPIAEKLTGWSLSEAEGRPVTEVFNIMNERTRQREESPVEKVMREGVIVGLANHTVLISKNGSEFPIADSGAPIWNDQGDIVGVVLVFRDVSEKRKVDKALRESEEKYRSMMEAMAEPTYICTSDFHVSYMNPAMIKRTGQDATGEVCHKAINDLDEQCPFCVHDKIQQGESVETEILSPKDKRYYTVSHSPIFHQDGSISKMTIYRDRTESKKAEEERIRLATAIEQASESIIISDKPGTVQYVNPAFELISGFNREEIIGQNFRILKSDKHDEAFYKEMYDIISRGNMWAGRITNRMKDGTLREFETRISPVHDSSGKIINFVSVNRDITQEVALEAQLQQSQKIQSIGTLAGGIAHDFNNILCPIIGYTEIAINDVPEDSLIKRNLEEVLKATKRARDLVQQILTFSRQSDRELKPLKVQSIVKEAMKLLRASIPSTITISQNINNDCGAISGDQTQIHQIIMNLCTNAYQTMEETGGQLELSLDEIAIGPDEAIYKVDMKPGKYARLTVSDTGHGMEPAVLERIFDPYFTTKEPGKGTGLGLSVVHGIVNTHGGHISASSEPGKGTKFDVYLPLLESAEIEAETVSPGTLATGDEHILLVDDEYQIVDVVRQMLERLGYQVTVRTSSIEALEAFRASPDKFDLVITDLTMPNMAGDKLSGELMNIRSDIPIILCTGFSNKMSEERANALGLKGFLMKPVIINALAKTVREVLDKS